MNWKDPIQIIALIGSILTIISFVINIIQYRTNQSLKTFLSTAFNAFKDINVLCEQTKDSYPNDLLSNLSSINTNAIRGKDTISLALKNIFNTKST
jgi:hypothetical protein